MKMIIVLSALVALAIAAPAKQQEDGNAVILKYSSDNIGVNGYSYGYETSNHIAHQEVGRLLNEGTDNEEFSVEGEYSYPGENGVVYVVRYIANKDGFQPVGAHLPK